jgi:hypothetical protein
MDRAAVPRRSRRAAWSLAAAAPLLAALGCHTVDLGEPPSDINACRPSQSYYAGVGMASDGGVNGGIWQNLLSKDYGGKHCSDMTCHGSASTNSLRLTTPTCIPPGCTPAVPLTMEWADDYRATAEQMNCANVSASKLLALPGGLQTHGGGMLFNANDPNAPEVRLIIEWIGAAP